MGEMLDRVAAALEPKCRAFGQGDMPMSVAREFARAAIEAMREPTPQMLATFADGDDPAYAEDWRAMIDAALDEK